MNEIVVYGSATHRNTGDLAMMHGLFRWLAEEVPDCPAILLTKNPEESAREFGIPCRFSHDHFLLAPVKGSPPGRWRIIIRGLGLLARLQVWRWFPRRREPSPLSDLFQLLSESRALVIHGSGSTNSIFWRGWLYPKAITALSARLLGKSVVISSQGIGPFEGWMDRLMARMLFHSSTYIGVRDGDYSAIQATALGAPSALVHHTGDDSWLVPSPPDADVLTAMAAEGIPGNNRLIGVNMRDASSYREGYSSVATEMIAAALDRLIEATGCHVVFIPVTYDAADDDRESAGRIANHMHDQASCTVIRGEYDASIIRGITGRMDICIGISYHFLLFALGQAVPSLALTGNGYYRAKHEGLLSLHGCRENCITLDGASADMIVDAATALLRQRETLSGVLKERIREMMPEVEASRSRMRDILLTV